MIDKNKLEADVEELCKRYGIQYIKKEYQATKGKLNTSEIANPLSLKGVLRARGYVKEPNINEIHFIKNKSSIEFDKKVLGIFEDDNYAYFNREGKCFTISMGNMLVWYDSTVQCLYENFNLSSANRLIRIENYQKINMVRVDDNIIIQIDLGDIQKIIEVEDNSEIRVTSNELIIIEYKQCKNRVLSL